MRVTLKRTRKGAVSIAFRAEDDADGVNLKNAVLASAKNGGFDLEDFESNSVIQKSEVVSTFNASGVVDLPVTLTKTDPEGGINLLVAVEVDTEGVISSTSNIATVEFDASPSQISFTNTSI